MKLFIRAFYGRLSQYSKSLDLLEKEDDKSLLEQTILNNIFKGNSSDKKNIIMFANSIINNVKKIQCFCFEEQVLMPYERQEWPVRFYVSSEVGDNVNDIYLSYTLFETDRVLTDNMNHGK